MDVPTCPACRVRYEKYHTADGKVIQHCPIGYATVYASNITQDEEIYLGTCRSYADLRKLIGRIEPGTHFTARLNIFLDEIGGGSYTRTIDGVEVRHESRAAEGLHLAMGEVQS